jgi:hypothetical protein
MQRRGTIGRVNGPENAASFFTRVFIFWEKLFFVDDDLG